MTQYVRFPLIAAALCGAVAVALAGCGDNQNPANPAPEETASKTTTESTVANDRHAGSASAGGIQSAREERAETRELNEDQLRIERTAFRPAFRSQEVRHDAMGNRIESTTGESRE